MSERIKQIMEKYGVDAQKAIEIMDRENSVTMFIHDYANPYGKRCH